MLLAFLLSDILISASAQHSKKSLITLHTEARRKISTQALNALICYPRLPNSMMNTKTYSYLCFAIFLHNLLFLHNLGILAFT